MSKAFRRFFRFLRKNQYSCIFSQYCMSIWFCTWWIPCVICVCIFYLNTLIHIHIQTIFQKSLSLTQNSFGETENINCCAFINPIENHRANNKTTQINFISAKMLIYWFHLFPSMADTHAVVVVVVVPYSIKKRKKMKMKRNLKIKRYY